MKKPAFCGTKVAIIGAGAVGSTAAYATTMSNIVSQISLIDITQSKEEGQVMDIADGLCFVETGCVSGADFADARNADIIVHTAGAPQQKGETRLDLVDKNVSITKSIFKSIGKLKKSAIVVVVANPVDVLTYAVQKITKLPHNQVFGTGTTLDTARLKTNLSKRYNVNAQDVTGYVMGEHGDSEFVAWSTVSIGGISAREFPHLRASTRSTIEKQVRKEAYEIIARKGSTHFGIGLVIRDIIEAIVFDQHKILPVSSRVYNYHGVSNICLGAPAVIGRIGVEQHWPVRLPQDERKKLQTSAAVLQEYISHI